MVAKARVFAVLLAGILMLSSSRAWALTDAELIAVRDGFGARRDAMLAGQVASPYPDFSGIWGKQDYALAALFLNVELANANQAVIDAVDMVLTNPDCPGACSLHWHQNLFFRIYSYFNANSEYYPGRLTSAAEDKLCQVMWFWLDTQSAVADAEIPTSRTWFVWASENHDIMHDTSSWGAAQVLKDIAPYNTYTCADGYTIQQHYDAWTEYFKEYLRERAKRGLFVEIAAHGYSKYTLQGIYNFYDFAEDDLLSYRAGLLLDLWWADWAHDQINATRSGGKTRIYQVKALPRWDDAMGMAGYYLNIGGTGSHPGQMCMATTTHRLPLVVMDIALDINGRGVYEFKSRRPGRNLVPKPPAAGDAYALDPDNGGIQRYTYTTPTYILGTLMHEKLILDYWSGISSQNRWMGLIFETGVNDVIYPQCVGLNNGKTYNQYWSVQNKNTLIVQRLDGTYSHQTGDMRVYFASTLTRSEQDGWVLIDNGTAYAAVKPAWGGYTWDDTNWLRLGDNTAPVIIEAAQACDYMDMYAVFEMAVLDQTIDVTSGVLTYTGLNGSGTFTFYTNSTQPPEVDGTPIDYTPDYTFDSPFMHEDWASGIVTISKDGRRKILDFNSTSVPSQCGEWGYYDSDLNKDCHVNITDVGLLLSEWLVDFSCSGSDYPTYDLTEDCNMALDDFAVIAADWDKCSEPNKPGCTNLLP